MKTAKELNILYKEALFKEIEKEMNEALEVLENEVAPLMESAARRGEFYFIYHAASPIAADTMAPKLEQNGYHVTKKGRKLDISWARD